MKPRVYAGVDLGGKLHQVQVTDAAGAPSPRCSR